MVWWLSYDRQESNDDLKSRLKSLEEKVQKPTGLQDKQLPTTDSLPVVQKDSTND